MWCSSIDFNHNGFPFIRNKTKYLLRQIVFVVILGKVAVSSLPYPLSITYNEHHFFLQFLCLLFDCLTHAFSLSFQQVQSKATNKKLLFIQNAMSI